MIKKNKKNKKTISKKNKYHNKIMDNNFNKDCAIFIRKNKCAPCKKYSKMAKKYRKSLKNNVNYKKNIFKKLIDKCYLCKNTNLKECNVKQYIDFSNAEKRNLNKII